MDDTELYLDLELEEEGEKELTIGDDTQHYLELVFESEIIDTGIDPEPKPEPTPVEDTYIKCGTTYALESNINGEIEPYAFKSQVLYKSANFPNATSVGDYAFQNQNSITTASFPNAESVGQYAFNGCSACTTLDLSKAITVGDYGISSMGKLTTVTIPSATTFGNSAFYGCSSLTSLDLPSATTFGNSAFFNCSKLTELELPQKVTFTSKNSDVFSGCPATLSLPAYEEINNVVNDLSSLKGVKFDNATSMADGAIQNVGISTLTLPKVTTVGKQCIKSCTSLTSVSLPLLETAGDEFLNSNTKLTDVSLPKITTFGSNAFSSCLSLTKITLPKVTSINGSYLCSGCTALTAFVITNEEQVCTLSSTSSCFANTPIKSGTGYIYVPDALVDSYKTATNWSTFASQIKPLSELPA